MIAMRKALRQEDQQRVGDVADRAKKPQHHRDGDHRRKHNGQSGPEVCLPAGPQARSHGAQDSVKGRFLKANESEDNAFTPPEAVVTLKRIERQAASGGTLGTG